MANTTALGGVDVLNALYVTSILALPPCRDTRHRALRRQGELKKCFRRDDAGSSNKAPFPWTFVSLIVVVVFVYQHRPTCWFVLAMSLCFILALTRQHKSAI